MLKCIIIFCVLPGAPNDTPEPASDQLLAVGMAWEQGYPNIGAVKDRKGVLLWPFDMRLSYQKLCHSQSQLTCTNAVTFGRLGVPNQTKTFGGKREKATIPNLPNTLVEEVLQGMLVYPCLYNTVIYYIFFVSFSRCAQDEE